MLRQISLLTLVMLVLAGCATGGGMHSRENRMNMIESSYGKKYIAEIPSAGNNVSDSLLATSLKMGPTVPSDNLLAHLQQVEPGIPTIVTSDSDVLAAATLERALKDGEGSIDGKKVVFVGGAQFQENLTEAANQANVELEFLVIPES